MCIRDSSYIEDLHGLHRKPLGGSFELLLLLLVPSALPGNQDAALLEKWGGQLGEGREAAYGSCGYRAVGRLSTLAELASPLLKENGVLVASKGRRDEEEEQQLERAAERLAMQPVQILDVGDRAGSKHRHLHVLRKLGPTPADLPRRPGMAKKRPRG